ncbi:MAG: FG-GAP repeat protein, partial [Planctomycetota bacterium]
MTRRCCVLLALLAGVVPACDAAATTILDTPTAKLLAPDGALGDLFGFALALDEGAAVIGAFSHSDVPGAMDATGAAYVFDADSGTLRFELRPGDLMPGDTIGLLVGADAGEALVFGGRGAYRFDTATAQEL